MTNQNSSPVLFPARSLLSLGATAADLLDSWISRGPSRCRLMGMFKAASLMAVWFLVPAAAHAQSSECSTVMAPMRDGTRLATDVYVPMAQGSGPFPVILTRTPYNLSLIHI